MKNNISKNEANKKETTSQYPSSEEDEPIQLPALNDAALRNRFRLTLIGRMFHTGGRSIEAFLTFMPGPGIWDIEGRVRGYDLGNGRFHFKFEAEEDLQKVLRKRPCHFNKWSFSLERWELNFQESLLSNMKFWIRIRDLPLNCWDEEAFRGIGAALGKVLDVDVTEARVLVSVDVTKPLKFKKKVITDKGELVSVTFIYEKLYRFCSNCFMISHEEKDCPLIPEYQRQDNNNLRQDMRSTERRNGVAGEERRRENKDFSVRRSGDQRRSIRHAIETRTSDPRDRRQRSEHVVSRDQRDMSAKVDSSSTRRQVRRNLYYPQEIENGEARFPVWQRLGTERANLQSWSREQSIQASSAPQERREENATGKGSEITQPSTRKDIRPRCVGYRRRNEPLRIRDLSGDEPSLEQWRRSRRPPRYQEKKGLEDHNSKLLLKESYKGKGKAIEENKDEATDEEDEDVYHHKTILPHDFEIGSGSGVGISPSENQTSQKSNPKESLREINEPKKLSAYTAVEKEAGKSDEDMEDWGAPGEAVYEEVAPVIQVDPERVDFSDWEQLAEEDIIAEKEITEEDMKMMADLEKEMILDGLLNMDGLINEDDLIGEDLLDVGQVEIETQETSLERTISEHAVQIIHPPLLVTTLSPISKRNRSPSKDKTKKSRKAEVFKGSSASPSDQVSNPIKEKRTEPKKKETKKMDTKKSVPKSPSKSTAASKKLKTFKGKVSPKKKSDNVTGAIKIPRSEESMIKKTSETKTKTPKDGKAEAQRSPDLPK